MCIEYEDPRVNTKHGVKIVTMVKSIFNRAIVPSVQIKPVMEIKDGTKTARPDLNDK